MGEDEALQRLLDILARPEFQVDSRPAWWQQLLAPVVDIVDYLLARLIQTFVDTATGREGWYGLGVLVVAVVLVIAGGLYLVRTVRLSVLREGRVSALSLAERRERSERLWRSAHELADAGQLSEAVRVLYLSALYALDERALLHVEGSQTNREHARRLSRLHPALGETFLHVVDLYDRLRYGRFPVTPAAFAELSGLVARTRTASLQGAAT